MSESSSLVPASAPGGDSLTTVIGSFEEAILAEADSLDLPTSGVVVDQKNRVLVLGNMRHVIDDLPLERRGTAMYLSKFMVAVGAGLLDAALNYLWDETIGELRKRIINYDLQYFFDQAATDPRGAGQGQAHRGQERLICHIGCRWFAASPPLLAISHRLEKPRGACLSGAAFERQS